MPELDSPASGTKSLLPVSPEMVMAVDAVEDVEVAAPLGLSADSVAAMATSPLIHLT